jgi:hypothetical protein
MLHLGRPQGRLFLCLFVAAVLFSFTNHAMAADPNRTSVSESVFGTKAGKDKKDAALNFVASALSITEAVSQKEIVDQDKFRDGLGQIIDGTVACLNASAWSKAK